MEFHLIKSKAMNHLDELKSEKRDESKKKTKIIRWIERDKKFKRTGKSENIRITRVWLAGRLSPKRLKQNRLKLHGIRKLFYFIFKLKVHNQHSYFRFSGVMVILNSFEKYIGNILFARSLVDAVMLAEHHKRFKRSESKTNRQARGKQRQMNYTHDKQEAAKTHITLPQTSTNRTKMKTITIYLLIMICPPFCVWKSARNTDSNCLTWLWLWYRLPCQLAIANFAKNKPLCFCEIGLYGVAGSFFCGRLWSFVVSCVVFASFSAQQC